MNENKFKKKTIIKTEEDIAMPFINLNQENKSINHLLHYIYDDDFVLMINELSTSILNYHKIISKYFANIRIFLNKLGESPYSTAIEGNCSNLESSFKKFYSNAKVVFRKMKLYRNEKFKNISNNKDFQNLNLKNDDKKNGLTIIINNNNNNNMNDNNINRNIGEYAHSPPQKNSQNFFSNLNKINFNGNERDENKYLIEKRIFDFSENIMYSLVSEKNDKLNSINQQSEYCWNKNYVMNRNNNNRIDFYDYISNSEKKIIAKINFLLESKNKVFNDIESLIEKSQKEKKEFKNQITSLKSKIDQIEKEKELISSKYHDKKNKLIIEKEKDLEELNENINELKKKIEMKENELKIEKIKNKEILEQKENLSNLVKKQKEEISNLEEEKENLNKDKEQKSKEFDDYKINYLAVIKSKEEYITSNSKIKKENEKYKNELNNITKQNKELNNEIKNKNKKIENLEEQNHKILEEIEEIKNENNNLIKENKNKEKEILSLKNNKKEINIEIKNIEQEYQDELNKKEQLINEFNQKYNELNEQYMELNHKIIENNKKIKESNSDLINIRLEKEKLTKKLNDKIEDYESIKSKYIALIENKSRETKMNEKNKNKILELEKEINQKNEKILEKQKELDENQEDIEKYINEIDTLKNEITTKNEQISKINSELDNKNKFIDEYKDLIKEEKNKSKELEEKYKELLSSKQNTNNIAMNSINIINNKLKVNTIDASRTKSANKTLIKSKNKFLIQTDLNKELTSSNLNAKILQTEIDSINKEEDLELTPENYIIVKCTELNSKLRWYLFKKKSTKKNINSNTNNNAFIFTHLKSYFKNSKSYRNTLNNNTSKNPELYDATYEDFIWKPFKNQKEFARFGELPISETKENFDMIEDLNKKIRKLEQNIIEKEKEYEILYINYNILNQKNKNFEDHDKLIETIDKLTKENNKLNEIIFKYKNEKNDDVGLSFIDNDLEGSKFLDDKGFEDIFCNLEKKESDKKIELNSNNKSKKNNNSKNNESGNKVGENNKSKNIIINKYLKDSINLLMNQTNMNQNAKSTLSSILIQLGCSDEDIYKIMGNYRGIISIGGIGGNKNIK